MDNQFEFRARNFRQPVFQRGHLVRTERSVGFYLRGYDDFACGSLKTKVDEFSAGIGLECLDQLRARLPFKQVICQRLDNVQTEHQAKDREDYEARCVP